ncbi:hypothetical protein J7K07_09085 [Candidatus Bathyarchaeota archaeon]|nr:hypothetical protein [Candidatus Bathyarchaeota archaeon]
MATYGWMGKILRVDLSTEKITEINTDKYVPDFIGGYGMALKLIWDETAGKPFPGEFDPEAPLIFATGPLAGTPAPTAGRCEVAGIAPQGYPKPWIADSGFGGDFATKMKFAGYDAIMIVGKADEPKYLYIEDRSAEILDASNLWGLYTHKTQQALMEKHGSDVAIATIGPAGENLVRLSIITTKTENAAGQGGFGAVMGSKKLKAIVVRGSCKVRVARPDVLIKEVKRIAAEIPTGNTSGSGLPDKLVQPDPRGRYIMRMHSGCIACGECSMPFQHYYEGVQQRWTGTGIVSGDVHCVGYCAPWLLDNNWEDAEKIAEFNKFAEWLGINHWEIFAGMNWFIQNCFNDGKLTKLMGEKLNLNKEGPAVYPKVTSEDPYKQAWAGFPEELAVKFLKAIAYREGDGDIFAEGTPRAAEKLGLQDEVWKTHKHGYAPHWDGRYLHFIHYPMWVISALVWATWGRDPFDSTHCAVQNYHRAVKEWGGGPVPYEQLKVIGRKIYGTEYAFAGWPNDPELGYRDKEIVVIWHQHSSIVKTSLPLCDQVFPLTWSTATPDMVGDYTAGVRLLNAVTGLDWTFDDLYKAAERCINVLRALHVRQGRTREHDESVIRYFQEQPSVYPDEIQTLDPDKFRALLDRYYERRGWDKRTGWPTREKLEELNLKDVADELARLGKLP